MWFLKKIQNFDQFFLANNLQYIKNMHGVEVNIESLGDSFSIVKFLWFLFFFRKTKLRDTMNDLLLLSELQTNSLHKIILLNFYLFKDLKYLIKFCF